MYAIELGDNEFVKQLLDLGADPNATSAIEKALHKYLCMDNLEAIELLLKKGASSNAEDVDGRVSLQYVKSVEAAKLLLNAGADPTIEDWYGAEPTKKAQK